MIAAAEQNEELLIFCEWYVKLGQAQNLSSLALSGLPKGRGQKGERTKGKGQVSPLHVLKLLSLTQLGINYSYS